MSVEHGGRADVRTAAPRVRTVADPTAPPRSTTFRGDVEGLRAVAVLAVLADHAGLPLTGGYVGVDVFFVVSGFLITSLLVAELARTGRVSLREFWARRARRLLPAATVVLVVTAALTVLLLPRTRWLDVGLDVAASAVYLQNWRLAGLAVDYQAQDAAVSPLQHYWSLAVEEQFYLVWPLLLVAVGLLLRSRSSGATTTATTATVTVTPPTGPAPRDRRLETAVVVAVAVVAVPSFAWSVLRTAEDPASAYFVTTTRLWELAVGGLTAVAAPRLAALPAPSVRLLGWAGFGAIALAAVLYTDATPFPGIAALAPVLGTAAVLAAGQVVDGGGPRRVLDVGPMRRVGRLSYSLYLWHWPLLAIAFALAGERSVVLGVAVVALSFVPAALCFHWLEDPVRRSTTLARRPVRSLVVGLGASVAALAVGAALLVAAPSAPRTAQTSAVAVDAAQALRGTPRIGAMVLADDPRDDPAGAPTDTVDTIVPDPLTAARRDIGPGFCSTAILEVEIRTCTLGDPTSGTEVVLLGDSHAQQWTTPLAEIARDRGWRLTSYTKSGCPAVEQDVAISATFGGGTGVRPYRECAQWRDLVLARLEAAPTPPAMVITSSGEHPAVEDGEPVVGPRGQELLVAGFDRLWNRLQARGTKVVVIADTPAPDVVVPDCVAANRDSLTECAFDREGADRAEGTALVAAARADPDVTIVDLGDAICPTQRCAPVIGGVLVWRDNSHVSASYLATLGPRLDQRIPPIP